MSEEILKDIKSSNNNNTIINNIQNISKKVVENRFVYVDINKEYIERNRINESHIQIFIDRYIRDSIKPKLFQHGITLKPEDERYEVKLIRDHEKVLRCCYMWCSPVLRTSLTRGYIEISSEPNKKLNSQSTKNTKNSSVVQESSWYEIFMQKKCPEVKTIIELQNKILPEKVNEKTLESSFGVTGFREKIIEKEDSIRSYHEEYGGFLVCYTEDDVVDDFKRYFERIEYEEEGVKYPQVSRNKERIQIMFYREDVHSAIRFFKKIYIKFQRPINGVKGKLYVTSLGEDHRQEGIKI
ncbi:MAG: hypothetical protein QW350_05490 [Candidatus Aenigmatarchaeota archaeon]|jgi:hypothetical protein